jgi:hypothetical protein
MTDKIIVDNINCGACVNSIKTALLKIVLLALVVIFTACNDNKKQERVSEAEELSLLLKGDSVATEVQNELLQNVLKAINQGGTDYAVDFCNLNAISITEKAAKGYTVNRLSDKNRNPTNALENDFDIKAFEKVKTLKKDLIQQDEQGNIYYYKPIMIGMPTCLQCHGGKEDITPSTQKLISQKYPNDKAVDYRVGDLRGVWKIHLTKQSILHQ